VFVRAGVVGRMKGTSKKQGGYRRDCSSESHAFSFSSDLNLSCLSLCVSDGKIGNEGEKHKLMLKFFFSFLKL